MAASSASYPAAMAATSNGNGADELCETVELRFKCTNLISMDYLSKSDPMVVVFQKGKDAKYREIGRTEMIKNNANPVFQRSMIMPYYFEEQQILKVCCYDVDNETGDLSKQDFLGDCYCMLSEIVGSKGGQACRVLKVDGKVCGQVYISADELKKSSETMKIRLSGTKLDKKDLFGKSDPYFVIQRLRPDGSSSIVYTSEVIKSELNPVWLPFETSAEKLVGGDTGRMFRVMVYDWDMYGKHDIIGYVDIPLRDLYQQQVRSYVLNNPETKKPAGTVNVIEFESKAPVSIIDYISHGFEISAAFSIDFTHSNGQSTLPNSLHFRNPYQPNEYQQAIVSIGEILAPYDSDNRFIALGFGARINEVANHCFYLNSNPNNPEVPGIQGILTAYQDAITRYTLFGPTNFTPIIDFMCGLAKDAKARRLMRYYVLVMITDGIVSDKDDTKRAIIRASRLPVSIIIIGVGGADFADMKMFDADDGLLSDAQEGMAARDCVNFVPFRQYAGNPTQMATETLREIPQQFLSYVRSAGIPPPPRNAPNATPQDSRMNAAAYRYA